MSPTAPDRLRNVALVGHRGAGKTALTEALLLEAGVLGRLGSVEAGTTASDVDPDERARGLSISLALHAVHWRGTKINLLDTPGDPSFVADALAALRVCESAVFVVNAVMGVEPTTQRLWERAAELGVARLVHVNLLDRERADFFRTLDALKAAFGPHVVATEIPLGHEHEVRGVIDLVDMQAWAGHEAVPIPFDHLERAQAARERLMDEVAETSEALMERYLDGVPIAHEEIVGALEAGTEHGTLFPVTCGVATAPLGADRLLDALVEDLPSPAHVGVVPAGPVALEPDPAAETFAYVFKTRADPYAGRLNLLRVYQGTVEEGQQLTNTRGHDRERIGQLEHGAVGAGDIGVVAKLKATRAGDWLAGHDEPVAMPTIALPVPVMAFAMEPCAGTDDEKLHAALARLQEEDPTIELRRDAETGEQIVAGLSQLHVEVVVGRLRERFGCEVELHPPRVPYRETIRAAATAHGRHKKQSGGRGQFGDCHIAVEPLPGGGFEFVDAIKGGAINGSFIPAVEKGVRDAMAHGPLAGHPVDGVRVRLVDGSTHTVDSSELAFRLAGAIAMREALQAARPVLLEPVMTVRVSVPDEHVGDVMGDLSSRRGRPLGTTTTTGGLTEVVAEVPMAELSAYAPDLRSLTGGQGEHTMAFARYEEVPGPLAERLRRAAPEAAQAEA